jgi:hypothetical protein
VGALSLLTLAVLGLYLFAGSAAPTLAAAYRHSTRTTGTVEGRVQSASGVSSSSRNIAVEFRDSRGQVVGRVRLSMAGGARFSVPISEGAQTAAVTISSGKAVLTHEYRLRPHVSLELRARFPAGGSSLLPAVFPQMG